MARRERESGDMQKRTKEGFLPGKSPKQLYGPGGLLDVCTRFYAKVFADPVMHVLFQDKEEAHAWRLAAFLTRHFGGKDYYSKVRGGGHYAVLQNHYKGMNSPLRGKDAGRNFTVTHRDRWLQYMQESLDEAGCSKSLVRPIMALVNHVMHLYGPFLNDRQQVADLEAKLRRQAKAKANGTASDKAASDGSTECPFAHAAAAPTPGAPSGAPTAATATADAPRGGGGSDSSSKSTGGAKGLLRKIKGKFSRR